MTWWSRLFKRALLERELDAELRDHFERQLADYLAAGMPEAEARRRARLALGGDDQIKEQCRDARGTRWVENLVQDVRYAFRTLRKGPAFASAVILTLALGIGATTTICTVVDRVLLQPLPFTNADRLVHVFEWTGLVVEGQPLKGRVTFQEFVDWRERTTTLDAVIGFMPSRLTVRTREGTSRLWGGMISGNAFPLLGTRALVGRTLLPHDDDDTDVIVLSFETWQRLFGSDPAIIGTSIEVPASEATPDRVFTIIGVLPAGFEFPSGPVDYYTPFALNETSRQWAGVMVIGRLRDGASVAAAADEANAVGAMIRPPRPPDAPRLAGPRFGVQLLKEETVEQVRPALRAVLSAAGIVLLMVCANVANLLLARGTARSRDLAVRLALGASRGRVIRQLMTESLVLAAFGGMLGALVAGAGVTLVKRLGLLEAPGVFRLVFGPSLLPRANELGVDPKMFAIAFGIAAGASVFFGLIPAIQLSRGGHLQRTNARGASLDRGASRTRAALVVAQVTLGTVLLVGAGLLVRSFANLMNVEKGYDPSNVLVFQLVFPPEYSITRKADGIASVLQRLRASPHVESAGFARAGLLIAEQIVVGTFAPQGKQVDRTVTRAGEPRVRPVSDGYLTAVNARIVEGRDLIAADQTATPVALVITRSVARRLFGEDVGVGRLLDWHLTHRFATQARVVGIVGDLRNTSPDRDSYPEVFVHYRPFLALQRERGESPVMQDESAIGLLSFAARTRGDPAMFAAHVRRTVRAVDPGIGVDAILPLQTLLGTAVAGPRFYALLLSAFATVAACLAVIGIYGVLAFAVVQRTHEIAVRMALGARRSQVVKLVVRTGTKLAAAGIVLGLIAAIGATRILQGLLFGVTPVDAATFLMVAVLFGVISAFASYLPAQRATRVEPNVVLRNE